MSCFLAFFPSLFRKLSLWKFSEHLPCHCHCFAFPSQHGSKQCKSEMTANQRHTERVCMRNVQSKPFSNHHHHHCKYVNILYDVCGNILTCRSLAFFRFNPSKCDTDTNTHTWKHLETIEMDWHGFVLKFGSKTNPICLHRSFFLPMCVCVCALL